MSIISSGSAAIAIQTMLKSYCLPSLKVLVDVSIDPFMYQNLRHLGCEIYETDLGKRPFSWREILTLTHNAGGFDITSNEALDPTTRFYDWMSYEILNISPDYCFIPFGTGNLFENVLNINRREISTHRHDPRFHGNIKALRQCHFIGATTNNPRSEADKLYSPHLPFVHYDEQWIRFYRYAGYCGHLSNVYLIKEGYLDEAMKIAESQGIQCVPSGMAGLALLLQMKRTIPRHKKILIVNTGKTKYPLDQ